jgi:hypothetical protein
MGGVQIQLHPFLFCNGIQRSIYPTIPTDRNIRVPDDRRTIWWWMERTHKPNELDGERGNAIR